MSREVTPEQARQLWIGYWRWEIGASLGVFDPTLQTHEASAAYPKPTGDETVDKRAWQDWLATELRRDVKSGRRTIDEHGRVSARQDRARLLGTRLRTSEPTGEDEYGHPFGLVEDQIESEARAWGGIGPQSREETRVFGRSIFRETRRARPNQIRERARLLRQWEIRRRLRELERRLKALSRDERSSLVARTLTAKPEASNGLISETLLCGTVSVPGVAGIRSRLEAAGTIPHVPESQRFDRRGRTQR